MDWTEKDGAALLFGTHSRYGLRRRLERAEFCARPAGQCRGQPTQIRSTATICAISFPEAALRVHRHPPAGRQDGRLHSRAAGVRFAVRERQTAIRLRFSFSQAIEGCRVGLPQRGGFLSRSRRNDQRERASRRLSKRRAGAALWCGQSGCAARHLSRWRRSG